MSVLVPDLKVYNYIQCGIEKIAYNSVIDEFYSNSIQKHFKNCPDISKESKRLILSWLNLNQWSYNKRYKDNDDCDLTKFYHEDYTHKKLSAIQLLKYLQCIEYNIEIEPEDYKNDLQLLKDCIKELTESIVNNLPEYKSSSWCD